MGAETYTCVAVCPECQAELFRATGVLQADRYRVVYDLPSKALCKVEDHNTFPEQKQNYASDITWYREKKTHRGKVYKLVRETTTPFQRG